MWLATIQILEGSRPLPGLRTAVVEDRAYIDLHATNPSLSVNMRELLGGGHAALSKAFEAARSADAVRIDAVRVKLSPPIPDPPKIICLGLNYRDHAIESGATIPKEPILFSKYATALIGDGDAIVLPPVSREVDYEAELVIVVGRRGRNIRPHEAMNFVAGYTIGHDVSARDWQLKKDLPIRLRLNGQTMQDSNTSQMIFDVPSILAYLSQVFTLEPGDLIFTGTPPGVGFARKPPVFLKAGDVVEVEIEGIGVLRNPVIQG